MESKEEFYKRLEARRLERRQELKEYNDRRWQEFLKFIIGHTEAYNKGISGC